MKLTLCVLSLSHSQKDEVYLNLVLEYIPETVYKVARYYAKYKQTIPMNFIKVRKHPPTTSVIRLQLVTF